MIRQELPRRFARFLEYHREHPAVWTKFVAFAEAAKAAGRSRFSARWIVERIRWYNSVECGDDGFGINDHFAPYYSRLLMASRPEFAGFFERRDTHFDIDDATLVAESLGVQL